MSAVTLEPTRTRSGYFYVWMSAASAVFALATFAGTYWVQIATGTLVGGFSLLHLHAALFTAWTLLFMSQAWLAAQGRLEHHRAWGVFGVALATAMVCVGMALAIRSVRGGIAAGQAEAARTFLILPFGSLTLFAIAFIAAVANVRRPDWHKRLILVGTVSLLQAAAARIGFMIFVGVGPGLRPGLGPPPPVNADPFGVTMIVLFLGAGMIYDWRTRGRPHAAYVIGLVVLLTIAFGGPAITATGAWRVLADGVLSLGA